MTGTTDHVPQSGADAPRHCRQPGCGTELPAPGGRGAPRQFCSTACSRKWHKDSSRPAGPGPGAAPGGTLAALQQLLAQAAEMAGTAAAELA
ncbi:MAG: hypothetical protein ACRDND_24105, partial [Streptosporangiaceae bacterium]